VRPEGRGRGRVVRAAAAAAAAVVAAGAAGPGPAAGVEGKRYARSVAHYEAPTVTLVDRSGEAVELPALLDHDGPVVLQFVFTTCPAVCPMLAGAVVRARERLGADGRDLLVVSISIDPEHDRPQRLAAWVRGFGGGDPGPRWRTLTGEREAIDAVRRAFAAGSADKMEHRPLTFVRGAPGRPWLRLEGFPGAADLAAEVRAAAR